MVTTTDLRMVEIQLQYKVAGGPPTACYIHTVSVTRTCNTTLTVTIFIASLCLFIFDMTVLILAVHF